MKKVRALSFLELLKLKKRKCPYFFHLRSVGRDMTIFSFFRAIFLEIDFLKLINSQKYTFSACTLSNLTSTCTVVTIWYCFYCLPLILSNCFLQWVVGRSENQKNRIFRNPQLDPLNAHKNKTFSIKQLFMKIKTRIGNLQNIFFLTIQQENCHISLIWPLNEKFL